jgi:hypothetical protein
MGFKIYITEKQLDVVLKDLMLVEQYPLLPNQDTPQLTHIKKKKIMPVPNPKKYSK